MPAYLSAQNYIDERLTKPALKLDLPLFDLPYQIEAMNTVGYGFFSSYANPSMGQSIAVTADMYSAFHYGLKYVYDSKKVIEPWNFIIYYFGIPLGDLLLSYFPLGDGWLHEEYHRAVMSRYGVNSFNGMNLFPVGAEMVSVSNIKDEGLISLKKKSPPDFVRLPAAGIEGEYLLINKLQRNNFFYNQDLFNEVLYWMITVNSHIYIGASLDRSKVDAETEKMNMNEKTVSSRDFTGFDMTAWVYDLFRPNEPYEARGIHPTGVGINRYRTTMDLSDDEKNYLQMQINLHFLNYLSPMLYSLKSIQLNDEGFAGNFAARHLLTSFGSVLSAQVFLKYETLKGETINWAFAYHSYLNYKQYFPAIEAELVEYPFYLGKFGMLLSPRVIIGTQPEDQKFKTWRHEFFGVFGLRLDFIVSKYFLPYFDFTAKTDGWVAGNEYLDNNVSIKIGISTRI
jgi:hypothetical protein